MGGTGILVSSKVSPQPLLPIPAVAESQEVLQACPADSNLTCVANLQYCRDIISGQMSMLWSLGLHTCAATVHCKRLQPTAMCRLPTQMLALQVKPTEAQYTLRDPQEVLTFLSKLVEWGQTDANAWHQTESCIGWALNTTPVMPSAQNGTHAEAQHLSGNGRNCYSSKLRAPASWLSACGWVGQPGEKRRPCRAQIHVGESGQGLGRQAHLLKPASVCLPGLYHVLQGGSQLRSPHR